MGNKSKSRPAPARGKLSKALRRQHGSKRKGPGVAYFAVLIGLTLCFSLAYVWLRMQRIELAYRLSQNRQSETELDKEHRRLLYTLATLRDPKGLETVGRKEFALRVPAPGQVVVLEDVAHD